MASLTLEKAVAAFLDDGDEAVFEQLGPLSDGMRERARLALMAVIVRDETKRADSSRLARFCRETRFFDGTSKISAARQLMGIQTAARFFPLAVTLLDLWPKDLGETKEAET